MDTFRDDPLVQAVAAYVKDYMSNYDASHDWSHIERVVGLSHYIYAKSANKDSLDLRTIHLAALLHDVGDKKSVPYIPPVLPHSFSHVLSVTQTFNPSSPVLNSLIFHSTSLHPDTHLTLIPTLANTTQHYPDTPKKTKTPQPSSKPSSSPSPAPQT